MALFSKGWDCAACGKRGIAGSEASCPDCFAARGSSEHGAMPRQMVRVYSGKSAAKDFAKDAAALARLGWRVQSQAAGGESSRYLSRAFLGQAAMARKRGIGEIVVTYERGE